MRTLRDLLGTLFDRRPQLARKMQQHTIWKLWPSIAGPTLSATVHPDRFSGTTLTLAVTNSVWMQELTYLKMELLEKIQAAMGAECVTDIRFELSRSRSENT